jgi:hypothetical protein
MTDDYITIPLSQGKQTIISKEDADLSEIKWCADNRHGHYRALRTVTILRVKRAVYLHRVILERVLGRSLDTGELVDHIDGDPLNNCRSNLRVATYAQNSMNSKRQVRSSSGYKGVYWDKRIQRYRAQITCNQKRIRLGTFKTPEEAHEAYKIAAVKYFGEFARFE